MSRPPKARKDAAPAEVPTTGHVWDGIQELDNPLPRWWVWVLYATIAWGVAYTIAYPAWPMVSGATEGLLGWSSRGDNVAEMAAAEAAQADLQARLLTADLATLAQADPELHGYAVNAGAALFRSNCTQCHGAGAAGVQADGFPNLLDDDWLWGGTVEDVATTVANGIRNEVSPDARWSEMPAFGEILAADEVDAVVNHVLALSGQEHDATLAAAGAVVFADNCAACHGDAGTGGREVGAPNLADAIWLYGGTPARIAETVRLARFGVMPAWGQEHRAGGLTPAEVNAVAVYVHGLGGGE